MSHARFHVHSTLGFIMAKKGSQDNKQQQPPSADVRLSLCVCVLGYTCVCVCAARKPASVANVRTCLPACLPRCLPLSVRLWQRRLWRKLV